MQLARYIVALSSQAALISAAGSLLLPSLQLALISADGPLHRWPASLPHRSVYHRKLLSVHRSYFTSLLHRTATSFAALHDANHIAAISCPRCSMPPLFHAAAAPCRHCFKLSLLHPTAASGQRCFMPPLQYDTATSHCRFTPMLQLMLLSRRRCFSTPLLNAAAASNRRSFTPLLPYADASITMPLLQPDDASRRHCNTTLPLHTAASHDSFTLPLYGIASA